MEGDFCNNYLPKIEFFKTRSGLSELRKKKTPLGHLLNETQFPFSSSTNFLERKEGIFPFLWTKLCSLWRKNLTGVIVPITCKEWVTMWQNGHFSSCNWFPSKQSTAKVAAYNRLYVSIKKMKSLFRLSVGDLKRDKTRLTACRKPKAEVAMLRLIRDEHIYYTLKIKV